MPKILLALFIAVSSCSFSQSVISSINSGAISTSGMIVSVGDIFVLPTSNATAANSGLVGVLSRLGLLVLGIDEAVSANGIKAYPNPTSKLLWVEVQNAEPIKAIYLYDALGSLVLTHTDVHNALDMTDFSAGIYYIKTNAKDAPSLKIIKQ